MADAQHYGTAASSAGTQAEAPTVALAVAPAGTGVKQESAAPHQPTGQGEATPVVGGVGSEAANPGEGNMAGVGSEINHGDEVVEAAAEFERQSRKLKAQTTVKAEAEPGPTDTPSEAGKDVGVNARTYGKGVGADDKDPAEWSDIVVKKEKESKNKKRKREEVEKNTVKQPQPTEDLNKRNAVEMQPKSKKKKKNAAADSTQVQPQQTQTPSQPVQQLTPQQQQQLQQQQQVVTASGDQIQFMHLTDDSLRDSLDLLSPDQKTSEYYSGEFQNTEFNESKPLADLLLNQNMVGYNQDGTLLPQGGAVMGTSQMIAQAYNQAQQLSAPSLNQQQLLASGLTAGQMAGQMGITIIPAPSQEGQATLPEGQTTMVTDEAQGGATMTINGATYTGTIVGTSQPGGSSSISAFPLSQNVIIASPGAPQQTGNFILTSTGQVAGGVGQNIMIAAPGHSGGFLVKQETQEELAQTLVLASQNAQQMGAGAVMGPSSTPHSATLSDGTNVVFTHPPPAATPTSESQPGGKAVTITSKSVIGAIPAPGATVQTQGGMQPVSLVLPPGSFLPQLQGIGATTPTATAAATSPSLLQMGAKVDKMLLMMQETVRAITETNKRLDRLESQLLHSAPKSKKSKTSSSASSSSSTTTTASTATAASSSATATTAASPGQSKNELKAALADYLTITGFNNKDELKRGESSSDLFIPVGTVSLPVQEDPSPSGETATSTVSELPDQNLLVLNNAAPIANAASEVDVPDVAAADSQSGIAVTIYDTEGGTYELGPDSSKDTAGARFTTVSQNPKTVIVDPKFWEMLVEDFQKNMTSKQIMSALANIRKPLVRNMGNNEISICSSVLKEAEEACQGRRERLAKELVFRIFTLGEVYDRNVSGVFYIKGKKMENKHKALDPAKMSAIRFLVMRYPPSVVDNPRLEKLVWKNCVDRINDALRRIYNWIHKLVDINSIVDKLPTHTVLQSP